MRTTTFFDQKLTTLVITAVNQLQAIPGTGNRWNYASQTQSCAAAQVHVCWFQSKSAESDCSKSVNQHFTKIPQQGTCHEVDREIRRDHV